MDNTFRLPKKDNTAYVLTTPHSLRFFSGFSGGEGVLVIGDNYKYLITDFRYIEAAENETNEYNIIEAVPYFSKLEDIFTKHNIKTAVIEDKFLSVGEYSSLKKILSDRVKIEFGSDVIEKARICKTEEEISHIRHAEEIGSEAYNYILGEIKEGVSEILLAAKLEYFMRLKGAEKTSFDTIVVSGCKTSLPHGVPSDKKITYGDFITMDFGCVYKGYCSDMTRTVVFGKASDKQREIYDTVLKAQLDAISYIKSGVSAKAADSVARNIIEEAGYGKNFGHSLGHGVGLLVHELPGVSPKSDYVLEENMVISCEPGIYIPDFGGVRIEDLLVVKKDGTENLTSASKKFTEIL